MTPTLGLEHRQECGGELKIVAAIPEQRVIDRILTPLELQVRYRRARPPVGRQWKRPGTQEDRI